MIDEQDTEDEETLEYLYNEAWKKSQSRCSDSEECMARVDLNVAQTVPHYILPGSEEERRWRQAHPMAKLVRLLLLHPTSGVYKISTVSADLLSIACIVVAVRIRPPCITLCIKI